MGTGAPDPCGRQLVASIPRCNERSDPPGGAGTRLCPIAALYGGKMTTPAQNCRHRLAVLQQTVEWHVLWSLHIFLTVLDSPYEQKLGADEDYDDCLTRIENLAMELHESH